MARQSKRLKALREKIERNKLYDVSEALILLKELSSVKFPESVDVSVNLGLIRANPIRSCVDRPSCPMGSARNPGCGIRAGRSGRRSAGGWRRHRGNGGSGRASQGRES